MLASMYVVIVNVVSVGLSGAIGIPMSSVKLSFTYQVFIRFRKAILERANRLETRIVLES